MATKKAPGTHPPGARRDDAPHGGRIVRLRLQSGEPPKVGSLKGARLRATSVDGRASTVLEVRGFAVFGGKPTDERLARTGRVDLHVNELDGPPVGLRWEVRQD